MQTHACQQRLLLMKIIYNEQCQDEQCVLYICGGVFYGVDGFSITFTNFPHLLLALPH